MIAKNEVLFEIYRIALKRDKYTIDIEGEDEIKCNRLFFDFMLRMFNHLNQLYEMEKNLLIDIILTYHLRKESAKENTSKPSPKKGCFEDMTNRNSQANSDSYKTDLNAKKGACNEARCSEEEHFGMRDIKRKGDFEHPNKYPKLLLDPPSGGRSEFFDEYVRPLTSLLYLSTRIFVLHLRLPISSYTI